MELPSINALLKRRRKLLKNLKPLAGLPGVIGWTEEDDRETKRSVEAEFAAIDAQIRERTGKAAEEQA